MKLGIEHKRLLAKNSLFNLLGQVLPVPVVILTVPYIVKGLGTNGYGILSIAWMVLGYFSMFDLGLSRATVKFVAEHLDPEKVHKVPELVWTSLLLLVGLGSLGGLVVAALVPFSVSHVLKMPATFMSEARTSLFILAASMPVLLGNDAIRGVLEAAQRFDLVNYVKVPASVSFYVVAALVIPFGVHISGIVTLLVLIRFASAVIYLSFCFRVFPDLKSNIRFSRAAVKPLTVFGGWIMVSNVTGPILSYLERLLIASLLSLSMLTFYSAPFDLVSKLVVFPASMVATLFPYFSFHGTKGADSVSEVTGRSLQYLMIIVLPAVAVFGFFARPILQLWLGAQFANVSTDVLRILSVVFFLNCLAYVPYTSVQALGRPDLKAVLDLAAVPTFAISVWIFVRLWGIDGAALAKLLITVIDCGFLYWFSYRMGSFSPRDLWSGRMRRSVVAGVGLLTVLCLLSRAHLGLQVVAGCALLALLAYVAVVWGIVLEGAEKSAITGLVGELTGSWFTGVRTGTGKGEPTLTGVAPVRAETDGERRESIARSSN